MKKQEQEFLCDVLGCPDPAVRQCERCEQWTCSSHGAEEDGEWVCDSCHESDEPPWSDPNEDCRMDDHRIYEGLRWA